MSKEIKLIYQDCVRCGDRVSWADQQYELAKHYGFTIKRVPHTAIGADGLIRKARLHNVNGLCFFTDGEKFSTELIDFVPKKKDVKPKEPEDQPDDDGTSKQRVRAVKARSKKVVEDGTETTD